MLVVVVFVMVVVVVDVVVVSLVVVLFVVVAVATGRALRASCAKGATSGPTRCLRWSFVVFIVILRCGSGGSPWKRSEAHRHTL